MEIDLVRRQRICRQVLKETDFPGEAYELARAVPKLIAEIERLRVLVNSGSSEPQK